MIDVNAAGVKVTQFGGRAILARTGYMIDMFRQSPKLREHKDIYYEKILKMVEDHNATRHLALVCGNGEYSELGPRWIPGMDKSRLINGLLIIVPFYP